MTSRADEQDGGHITVHFMRSPDFRIFHINGIFGGITPTGEISMALYVDRHPFPSAATYAIENGAVGSESEREIVEGLEREIQAEVRMSVAQAISIRGWLDDKIEVVQAAIEQDLQRQVSQNE